MTEQEFKCLTCKKSIPCHVSFKYMAKIWSWIICLKCELKKG